MPSGPILTLGLLLVAGGLMVLTRGLRHARTMRQLRDLTPTPLAELRPGLAKTRGSIHVESPVTAPLTKRPAAYYYIRAQRLGEPGKKPRQLAANKEWGNAAVGDTETRVVLEPWTPLVASGHKTEESFEGLERVPPDKMDLFERLGIADKHLPSIQPFKVTEYRLEHGDDVHVTGTFDRSKGFYRAKRKPFIVSAYEHIGYLKGLRNELVLYVAAPPMLLIAGAIIFFLGLA